MTTTDNKNTDIRLLGFVGTNDEGDTTIEFFSDLDFALIMPALEDIDAIRFILHRPKRNIIKVYCTRPFNIVRNKIDEIFEIIFKTKPKYFESIE